MKPLSFVFTSRRATPKRTVCRSAAVLLSLSGLIGLSRTASAQILPVPVPLTGSNVTTHHNNNARTGVNGTETRLTPATLTAGITEDGTRKVFGKMFDRKVDGEIYGQPLYVSNVTVTDYDSGRVALRNVVYVVTTNGSIYAFDADANTGKYARPYWIVNFDYPAARVTALDASDVDPNYADFGSKLGIVGTPVIDVGARQALYVVVRTREGLSWRQRLYAFDLSTGQQRPNSPQLITGYVPGIGDGAELLDDGTSALFFDDVLQNKPAALMQNQQAALLLQNNKVFVAWGSHADIPPYHGWVMAFDADTLQRVGAFVTTPDSSGGGISMSGAGIAGDGNGNIYVVSGNGTFDRDLDGDGFDEGTNLGQSVLKLRVAPAGDITVADYFTPFNQGTLTDNGIDLTTGGIVLLPTSVGSTAHPELLVTGGLEGRVYLLDRKAPDADERRMGHYNPDSDQFIVQSFRNAVGALFGTPAFLETGIRNGRPVGTLFYSGSGDVLKAFEVTDGQIRTPDVKRSRNRLDYPGATPSISANITDGVTTNAIVWTIGATYPPTVLPGDVPPAPIAYLLAHDAADVSKTLFNSQTLGATNAPGNYTNFSVPTIANGKVYVAGKGRLTTYGFTKPQEARASRFLITGPNRIPALGILPALSSRIGYNFCITAIGANQRPIVLGTKLAPTSVQLAFRTGSGALQSGGTINFAGQSSIIVNRAFINAGGYEMIVTDKNGTSSSTRIAVKGNTDEGTDRFVLNAKSTASVGEIVPVTVRSVSAAGTPVIMYDIQTTPVIAFVPHRFLVYGTRVDGTQDLDFTAPGWAYDALPANRTLPAPAPQPQLFFESVKVVQIQMNEPGEQVIVVTDGANTGSIKITVR